jgi:hypothetical protein
MIGNHYSKKKQYVTSLNLNATEPKICLKFGTGIKMVVILTNR